MPGLINMHTHFSLSLPGAGGDAVSALDPHELALYMADGARRTLLSGVTTVRCVAEKGGARLRAAPGDRGGPRARPAHLHRRQGAVLHRRARPRHRRHARMRRRGRVRPRCAQPGQGRRRPHQAHDLGRHRRRARADHDTAAHARRDGGGDLDRPRVGPQGHGARRPGGDHRRGRRARPRLRRARLRADARGRRD